jgi:Holliday junction resolvasome RuvABC endonuclease subunit
MNSTFPKNLSTINFPKFIPTVKQEVHKIKKTLKKKRTNQSTNKSKCFLDFKNSITGTTNPPIIFGIDMSLSNPSLCCLNYESKIIQLYFFRNRCIEPSFKLTLIQNKDSYFYGWLMETICIENEEEKEKNEEIQTNSGLSLNRFKRYINKIIPIVSLIQEQTKKSDLLRNKNIFISIEHYALSNQKNTNCTSTLMELGGCLRFFLSHVGVQILELAPTTIKKVFSNSGKIDKDGMYKTYKEVYKLPNLFDMLNLTETKYTHVPNPINDMVDALATAITAFTIIECKKEEN